MAMSARWLNRKVKPPSSSTMVTNTFRPQSHRTQKLTLFFLDRILFRTSRVVL